MKRKYTSPEFEEYKFKLEAIMGEITPSTNNPDFNEDHDDDNNGNLGD